MTRYVVMSYGQSSGKNMYIEGKTKAKSAEKAVEKVTGRSVDKDTYSNAPETGYVAVAESNWNQFR